MHIGRCGSGGNCRFLPTVNLCKALPCHFALTPTTNSTNETQWRWLEQSTGQGRPSGLACRGPVSLVHQGCGTDRARPLICLIDSLTGPSSTRTLLRTGELHLSILARILPIFNFHQTFLLLFHNKVEFCLLLKSLYKLKYIILIILIVFINLNILFILIKRTLVSLY